MRQQNIAKKRAAEKKAKLKENLGDLKERAEATVSFLPPQVIPIEERIKIKEEIKNSSSKEEFSRALSDLFNAIKKTKGEEEAKRIVSGMLR